MKHMFLKSVTSLALVITVLFAACSKGDTGPQGEQGEKGDAGPTGKTGTANVIYSDWLNVGFDLYKPDYTDTLYVGGWDCPALTDSILNYGVVKVYFNYNSADDPRVVALPMVDQSGLMTGYPGFYLNPIFSSGSIGIQGDKRWDPTTFQYNGAIYWQYRYVVIPPGVFTDTRLGVDWNDYAQVKKFLNLKN